MSLLGIIGQLQSIQPTRRDVTAQSLALDITKARNSILQMARLLQNSGRTQSNQYVPNQASTTKRADNLTKEIRKTSGNLERLSGDQKRFKGFVQQTVRNIDKQLRSFGALTKRNDTILRSIQSEIGLGRPQRAINYAFGTSAAQVPSYGRNIKSQLNRLSQQIKVLNSNQQRMIRETEKQSEDRSRGDMGIIGGRPGTGGAMRFTQKLGALNMIARKNIAETQLPGMTQPGNAAQSSARLNSLYGGMALYLIANVKGNKLLEMMVGKEAAEFLTGLGKSDWKEKIEGLREGTPYKLDGEIRLKGGKAESDAIKQITSKIDELKKQMSDAPEIDTKTKDKLLEQIDQLNKQRLEALKKEGIVTQEHVKAGLAKADEITYYENKSTAEIAGRYIPVEVAKQYSELYNVDTATGSVQLRQDYKEQVAKLPAQEVPSISTAVRESRPESSNTVVYRDASGKVIEVKEGGTISWRNNNPGNINYGEYAKQQGAIGSNGGFAVFPDYETGKNAMRKLLAEGKNYKNDTLWQAIGADGNPVSYAPKDDGNDPVAYAMYVQEKTGLDVKRVKFAELSASDQNKVLMAMIAKEGYQAGRTYTGEQAKVLAAKSEETNPTVASNPNPTVESITPGVGTNVSSPPISEAQTEAMLAQQVVKEEQVNDGIATAQGYALSADMKVNKLYKAVEKNSKEINSVREYVRVATGASDFSVRNPVLDKSWNV